MDKNLDNYYQEVLRTPSDINEHLETLVKYASECSHITECGVRSVVSSWAFLKGLTLNSAKEKNLISVDLDYSPNIENLRNISYLNNINFKFIQGNDIKVPLDPTDLLFIDTWHVYGHLKCELETLSPLVNKYIILHDTTVDAVYGEAIRCGSDLEELSRQSGYPISEISKGLWPAITEFLDKNPRDWILHQRFTHNNGLTILRRITSTSVLKPRSSDKSRVFDWKWYLNHYPDLRRAGLKTEKQALDHYQKHGIREGRRTSE